MGLRNFLQTITIPGVVIHEYGHKLFCDITKVRVRKVCYFRFGNPAGYVVHDKPERFFQSLLIVLGPFMFGTLFALLCYFYSFLYKGGTAEYVFIWLGFSAAYNCFPSDQDAKVLWSESSRHLRRNILALLGYPFSVLIWIENRLSYLYFDVIYGVVLYFACYKILNITMLYLA
jgi:hypothetical protein